MDNKLTGEMKFYITLWSLLAGVISLIVVCLTIYHTTIDTSIASNTKPLEVSCALNTRGNHSTCILLNK